MTQEQIKEQRDILYKNIKDAEDGLKILRSICKHPNTFEGNYSWRIGACDRANICSDCGELINYAHKYITQPEHS